MDSKAIADREVALHLLEAFLDDYAEYLYTAYEEYMAEVLEEAEDPPNLRREVGLLRRRLRQTWQTLETSHDQVVRWLGREIMLRAQRDAATTSFGDHLAWRRKYLEATFDKLTSDTILALRGRVPQKSRALWRQGKLTLHALRQPAPTEPRRGASKPEPEEWLSEAEKAFAPLNKAMRGLVKSTRALQAARYHRDEALDGFNLLFLEFASILVAYLRLIGRQDLAREILPSRQEPGLFKNQVKRRRSYLGRHKKSGSRLPASSSKDDSSR